MAEKKIKPLDDIVFEHKNKNYGAYRLRKNQKAYLLKAFLIGVFIFMILMLILYYYNTKQVKSLKEEERIVKVDLQDVLIPEEEEKEDEKIYESEPKEIVPPVRQERVASIKAIMPDPKNNVVKEETVPEQKDKEKAWGKENIEGDKPKDAGYVNPGQTTTSGIISNQKPPDDIIYDGNVQIEAEYPGGIDELRRYVARQPGLYPEKAQERRKEGRVMVKFVVEKDGRVGQFTVQRDDVGHGAGQNLINILKRTKRWKPAQVNGKPVRSVYRFPVVLKMPPE